MNVITFRLNTYIKKTSPPRIVSGNYQIINFNCVFMKQLRIDISNVRITPDSDLTCLSNTKYSFIRVYSIARTLKVSWNYDSINVSMNLQKYICFIEKVFVVKLETRNETHNTKFSQSIGTCTNITRLSNSFLRLWCIVKIPSHKPLLWTFQICFYFPPVYEVHLNAQINHRTIY